MAAQGSLTPSEYIAHHLTNLTVKVGEGGFWTLNMDTIVMSWVLGLVGLGLIWLVAGVCLAGAVHDSMILWASTRRGAKSMADLVKMEIGGIAGPAGTAHSIPLKPTTLYYLITR